MKTTKRCTQRNQIKNISEFGRDKHTKDNLKRWCKECMNAQNREYKHSKEGIAAKIYSDQRKSSNRRGHIMPTYTMIELREWMMSQKKFHILYDNWKRLDYQKMYIPSVDRIDDSIGYTMANIQLMTWRENKAKGHSDHKSGKLDYNLKPVFQYTKDGNFVKEYISAMEAERDTGVHHPNISKVCLKKREYAGGYIWKFR